MPVGLMERGPLLGELHDALVASASGGHAVLVAGEAGIGKSALVRAFMRTHADEAHFLVGLCDPLLTPRALGPLHDIARQTGGGLAAALADGSGREVVFAAFLDELAGRGRRRMIVVEDAHWADEATLDLLVFLGRRLDQVPAALVVTFRDDELVVDHPLRRVLAGLPADRVQHVRPAPLSKAAVIELALRAGAAGDGLHELTGGNPLLVTEVLAAGSDGVPGSVQDLALARLASLSAAAQEVVRFVAVVPTETELWLLEQARAPEPDVLEACRAAGLLVLGSDAVAFRHELIRQAVESSLSPLRRRELNRGVLEVLTVADGHEVDPARLAHHARESGDGVAVLRFASAAAEQAAALGSHREAVEHYRAALPYADRLRASDRAELLERASVQTYLVGQPEEALAERQEALRLREDSGELLRVGDDWRWVSRLAWMAGHGEQARDAAARAIAVLEQAPPGRELAMAYSTQSQLDMLSDRSTEAIAWGQRALELARPLGDLETVAHTLTNTGTARLKGGDLEGGRAELEASFALASRQQLHDHAARALVNLAYEMLEHREYRQSGRDLERALHYAVGNDLTVYAQYAHGMRAWWRLDQGDWAGAEADALEGIMAMREGATNLLPSLVTWARLLVRRGDERAVDVLDDAASRAYEIGELQRIGPVSAARAEHARLSGEPDRAVAEAARGLPLALQVEHPWFAGELLWRGRPPERRPPAPSWVAEPWRLLLTGQPSQAAKVWAELGCPYEEAEALSASDHDDDLLRALECFDGLGAVPAARLVRRRLTERGTVRVPRGPRPTTLTNPAGLTVRQLDVLGLLAGGLSNAEIARRLSLSVRTVDHHVSAVLAKLGVDSRGQATEAARQRGVVLDRDGHRASPT